MFTAAIEEIFKRLSTEAGINISGEKLNKLRFADDVILFAESEEKLKELLEDLNEEGKKDRMRMNKKKAKIMCNEIARRRQRKGAVRDGEDLKEVTQYKYLGRMLTPGNDVNKESYIRVETVWRIWQLFEREPMCLKRKITGRVISPAMAYGAETWTLTKQQERKLAVAQRSHAEHHQKRQD